MRDGRVHFGGSPTQSGSRIGRIRGSTSHSNTLTVIFSSYGQAEEAENLGCVANSQTQ